MVLRQALVRAIITFAVLMALAAVTLYAIREQLPHGGGFKLLGSVAVEDPTISPPICLMDGCEKTEDASKFCLMRQHYLRNSATDCSLPPLRIRLVQGPSQWPMRPGEPL